MTTERADVLLIGALALDVSTRAPEHTATIEYNGDFDLSGLLRHLHTLGAAGASRDVVAMDGDDQPVNFNFDGDGADKILSATVDGVDILKDQ